MSLFEHVVNSLMPHPQKAQMVLGLGPSSPGLDKTMEILASCGAESAEAVLIVRASVPACQDAVIKLTENGFKKLQAVYPPETKASPQPKA